MNNTLTAEEIMQKVATGKPFILLLLLTGPTAPPEDQQQTGQLQMAHLSRLFQLEQEGHSCIFGPISNDERLRGLIVFNTTDREKIHGLMADDPWIKGGYLTYELYDWFSIPGQKIPG